MNKEDRTVNVQPSITADKDEIKNNNRIGERDMTFGQKDCGFFYCALYI